MEDTSIIQIFRASPLFLYVQGQQKQQHNLRIYFIIRFINHLTDSVNQSKIILSVSG